MVTNIKNQGTSAQVRAQLAAENRPVCLAFSCGKDSLATWCALLDEGIEVKPAYLYAVPGLKFVDDTIKRFEDFFQTRIRQYPHPSLYRLLNSFVVQAPERLRVIEAAKLPEPDYVDLWRMIREEMGVAPDTWVADGTRAADSIVRRGSFIRYGYFRQKTRKVMPIGDWTKSDLEECFKKHNIELPIDYEWFGRSFDGIDSRFTEPLKKYDPEDYQKLLDWFPLLEVDHVRHEI